MDELWRFGAADLAGLIRDRQTSSVEVLKAFIGRIEEVNGDLNAVSLVMHQRARESAEGADKLLAKGERLGPLHGVPVSIKENIDVAGLATSVGVEAFKSNIADHDSAEVSNLLQAGAIPFARTNCPDFAVRWYTHSSAYGQTFNPWNRNLTPGGSSGGEAVALATGMTPLGLGTDLGGSLRYPAQCCGISSLKPTLGRFPQSSMNGAGSISIQMFGVSGPMARHVRDLRVAYGAMAKPNRIDPWWTPAPLCPGESEGPVKVGLCLNAGNTEVHSDVLSGVKKAADTLSSAGYIVEEVEPPLLQEAADLWGSIMAQDMRGELLKQMEQHALADGLSMVRNMLKVIAPLDYEAYVASFVERHVIASQWSRFMGDYPLLLAPVSTRPPFLAGEDAASERAISEIIDSMVMVVSMNLLGLPVVTLPVGEANGLPQSVQLIGDRFQESLCLDAAEAVENSLGVITPVDPVS